MGCCIPYVSILLSPGGYLGTGLFFFMSGYGLYHSMAFKEILPASYLWKRLLKMWCAFIVAYMLTSIPMMRNNEFGGQFNRLSNVDNTSYNDLVFQSHCIDLYCYIFNLQT